jgi:hypothetical protein
VADYFAKLFQWKFHKLRHGIPSFRNHELLEPLKILIPEDAHSIKILFKSLANQRLCLPGPLKNYKKRCLQGKR